MGARNLPADAAHLLGAFRRLDEQDVGAGLLEGRGAPQGFVQALGGAGIGAGIGLALGYIIGNEWDKYDQQQLNRTLEYTPSGQATSWRNPDNGASYTATPQPAYSRDNRTYRDVKIKAVVDGNTEYVDATAYRQPDGTWRLVQ